MSDIENQQILSNEPDLEQDQDTSDDESIEMEDLDQQIGLRQRKGKSKPVLHWTSRTAERLRDYAYKAAGSAWIHGEDAAYFNGRNSFCNLYIGVVSAISAVGLAGALVFVQDTDVRWRVILFYVFSILSLLANLSVAVMKAYQWAKGFDKKIADNSEKSSKFGDLYRKILDEFAKDVHDRIDAYTMLAYTKDRFNELEREKPFSRGATAAAWDAYVSALKENKYYDNVIPLPEEFVLVGDNAVSLGKRNFSPLKDKNRAQRFFGMMKGKKDTSKRQRKIDLYVGNLV